MIAVILFLVAVGIYAAIGGVFCFEYLTCLYRYHRDEKINWDIHVNLSIELLHIAVAWPWYASQNLRYGGHLFPARCNER